MAQYSVLPGVAPRPQQTEPIAIAGLVLAFVAAPIGLILSVVALKRISRSGDRGRGIALAGAIVSSIGVALVTLALVAAVAIPVFLNQRQIANETVLEETLSTASLAASAHLSSTGRYPASGAELAQAGFVSTGPVVEVVGSDAVGYCLSAIDDLGTVMYSDETGATSNAGCP